MKQISIFSYCKIFCSATMGDVILFDLAKLPNQIISTFPILIQHISIKILNILSILRCLITLAPTSNFNPFAPSATMPTDENKRQRVSKACDSCRRRKVKYVTSIYLCFLYLVG